MDESHCTFCRNSGELHQVESPAIRLCTTCREKLSSHIAVVCTNCNSLYWLPKSGKNVMQAAEMSGQRPDHIMDNAMVHEIKSCRRCYQDVAEFAASVPWVQ